MAARPKHFLRYGAAALCVAILGAISVHRMPYTPVSATTNPATTTADQTPGLDTTFHYNCPAGSDPESLPCLQQHYQTVTYKQGVQTAFAHLKAAYVNDAIVKSDCHQLSHAIGRTAADMYKNVDDAYAQGDNFCWSGYYHGVMESIVSKIGAHNLTTQLPNICAHIKAQKPYSFYHYNCVHGLGHGIMDVTGSDLFASLKLCDTVGNSWENQSCYGGVFMENEMDEVNANHSTKYLKADQPMYPCTAVADQYKQQCYLMQTSHALRAINYNFSTVFYECAGIESQYVDTCYQSLGRDASGSTNSDVARTKATCMLGATTDAQSNCIVGAVKDFVSYYHSDAQATQLCLALDPALQATCQATKTQYYSTF